MAGDVDYLLRVAVGSMADFDDFYRRLIAAIPCKNVTSRFAMERVKFTTAYPIPPEPTTKDAPGAGGRGRGDRFNLGRPQRQDRGGRLEPVAGRIGRRGIAAPRCPTRR